MSGTRIGFAALALIVGACGASGEGAVTTIAPPTTLGSIPEVSSTTTTSAASTTIAGSATTTTAAAPTTTSSGMPALTVAGTEEVVYDWSTDRCDDFDIPDLPARAFQDVSGQVNLISSHTVTHKSTGPTLNDIVRRCEPIFESSHDPDPAQWTDSEWLASTWTADGETVYGLVHNEYHGWERGDCSGGDAFECWYNAVTAVISTDGGNSFQYVADPPQHLVASLPHRYRPETAAVGVFSPSNIVSGPDDHWYALAKVGAHRTGRQTVCLMRTPDLADPGAWRFWDRSGFDGEFVDPYLEEVANTGAATCPALDTDDIGAQMIESLTWNTYLERWVLVGISADTIEGREIWGFYYSFSDDLIDWTRRRLLLEVPLPWTVDSPGSDLSYLYPSLLDPASESLSFETTGQTAYLYYTRNNAGHASLDRDLVRVPVEFSLDG